MRPLQGRRTSPTHVAEVALAAMRGGRLTVRGLADMTGHSTSTVHDALTVLKGEGLAAWEPGQKGTLRATMRTVLWWGAPYEPDPLRCLAMSILEPTEPG